MHYISAYLVIVMSEPYRWQDCSVAFHMAFIAIDELTEGKEISKVVSAGEALRKK